MRDATNECTSVAADSVSSERRDRWSWRNLDALTIETCRSKLKSDDSVTPSKRMWSRATVESEPSCKTGRQPSCWERLCLDPGIVQLFSLSNDSCHLTGLAVIFRKSCTANSRALAAVTFWISLSRRLMLSPQFRLWPKISPNSEVIVLCGLRGQSLSLKFDFSERWWVASLVYHTE